MAYLKDIWRPRCECGKLATVELFNFRNATHGYYCARCGKRALARQQVYEQGLEERA